jgi:hypothetical protein
MSNFGKYKSNISVPSADEYESPFKLFNKINDQNLFNIIDEEQIRLGGSPLLVYKYFQNREIDDVYGEQRSKSISQHPIRVYGHYEPRPIEEDLTQFGVELKNNQQFTFNKNYVERRLGRPLIAGDIIKPEFQNLKYEVFEVQEDSFETYGVYHLVCGAKLLRDSDDIHRQIVPTSDQIREKEYLFDSKPETIEATQEVVNVDMMVQSATGDAFACKPAVCKEVTATFELQDIDGNIDQLPVNVTQN